MRDLMGKTFKTAKEIAQFCHEMEIGYERLDADKARKADVGSSHQLGPYLYLYSLP